jgi:signal peptidase I
MAKFKIGDRVKVVRNNGFKFYNRYIGKEFDIIGFESCGYKYNICAEGVSGERVTSWRPDELELITKKERVVNEPVFITKKENKMTKEEFIEKYCNEKVAVHCKTEELAREFLELADSFGFITSSGTCVNLIKYYSEHKEDTCYTTYGMGNKFGYCELEWFKEDNMNIIEFKSLSQLPQPQKSLLKSGDKVVYRDGSERFVLIEIGTLYTEDGRLRNRLDEYLDNLTIKYNKDQDIMQVYRNNELIMQRTEKSDRELKIEEIQRKMDELKAEMEGLK